MSAAPPGAVQPREAVLVAGGIAPGTAASTRMAHVKRLLTSRGFVWIAAVLAGAGFLFGAATDRIAVAVGAPVAVLFGAVVIAYLLAVREAALDFYNGFADARGFSYTPRLELMESTPLLGAGDRRRCEHYMEGPLSPELPGIRVGLTQYTYEVSNERNMRRNRTVEVWTPYNFTIAVVELQQAIEEFPGVFLGQRRGMFGRVSGESWLDYDRLRKIELESSDLVGKYELFVRRNIDQTRLLELFQPSFQVWLGRLPMPLCFEFSGGVLVAYSHRPIEEAGPLDIMLQATAKIAKRIFDEAGTQRSALHSIPDSPADAPPPNGSSVSPVDLAFVPPLVLASVPPPSVPPPGVPLSSVPPPSVPPPGAPLASVPPPEQPAATPGLSVVPNPPPGAPPPVG